MNDLLEITPSVQDRARISTQVCDSTASLLHALESGVGGSPMDQLLYRSSGTCTEIRIKEDMGLPIQDVTATTLN